MRWWVTEGKLLPSPHPLPPRSSSLPLQLHVCVTSFSIIARPLLQPVWLWQHCQRLYHGHSAPTFPVGSVQLVVHDKKKLKKGLFLFFVIVCRGIFSHHFPETGRKNKKRTWGVDRQTESFRTIQASHCFMKTSDSLLQIFSGSLDEKSLNYSICRWNLFFNAGVFGSISKVPRADMSFFCDGVQIVRWETFSNRFPPTGKKNSES